ncbi:hypothetical protein PV338_32955, partial [Streptomyces scabiei]|nr:hypothetical protein [Streptomyces scabiei]
MSTTPRMLLVLSENWTLTGGRADLPAAVRWAREAEDAGFDSVMVSEHIVLGPDAAPHGTLAPPPAPPPPRTPTPPHTHSPPPHHPPHNPTSNL